MPPSGYIIAHSNVMPQELQALDQWVIRDEQKRPINPATGKLASPTDPTTWSSYATATATGRPLGFVFTEDDPYVGIDLDRCRDPETGAIAPEALAIIDRFSTYAEISPSGTGVHLIGRGVKPTSDCTKKFSWGKIECYDHTRYFTMTGRTLPGHDTIRSCQRELTTWHREVWSAEPERPKRPVFTFTSTGTSRTKEQILEVAFRAQNGDSIRRLYGGDITGYPESQSDPGFSSEADLALVSMLAFYFEDDAELADAWRSSGLYRRKLDRNDYVNKTILKARSGQSGTYSPGYASQTREPEPPPAEASCDVLLAATRAELAQARQTILVLQERVRLADEREAIQRNTKLGAARQTGAALATLFREERPKEPDTPTGYRMPLAKLAERTGLSADACSRQLKQLAKYRTPDGTPVLHIKTRAIPRSVNQETGEIIEPHKEVWVGPGPIQHDAFGHVLATLTPADAPKHGGAPDRGVCPEHPNAGVLRRTSNMRRITHSCAHCQKILDTQVIPVGREATEHLRSMAAPPDPIQQDAFAPETDQPPTARPMPQDAGTMGNHTGGKELSSKMWHSPPPLDTEPPDFWIPPDDRHRYQPRHGESAGHDRWTA